MKLVKEPHTLTYRKDTFNVLYHVYECEDSGERFTDDALDEINMAQVYNQYREKYRIPFPEEIRNIRKKYAVSANKMSDILGLGANSYRLYENGEMPSVAIGRLILSVAEPDEFIKQVKASAHILSDNDSERIIHTCMSLKKVFEDRRWERMFEDRIFKNQQPNEYSGFKQPDINRIAQVIAYFDGKIDLFKTKLNKLLFYADFYNYKLTGYSITGITYRAIPYGPVPAEYEKLYSKLCDDQVIDIQEILISKTGDYAEQIRSKSTFNQDDFTPAELKALQTVADAFKNKTTKEIVDISHKEKAWLDNESARNDISYQQYAFNIKFL